MYLQFQFLSLYKVRNTKLLTNFDRCTTNNVKKPAQNILTSNIQIFYFILFMLKSDKVKSPFDSPKPSARLSFFFLPRIKKNTIFLRAPYKNKLARLNIVRVHYKFLLALQFKTNRPSSYSNSSATNFISSMLKIDFSSAKIKHLKTIVVYKNFSIKNFSIKNFN